MNTAYKLLLVKPSTKKIYKKKPFCQKKKIKKKSKEVNYCIVRSTEYLSD